MNAIEATRRDVLIDLLGICRSLQNLQRKLTPEIMQLLSASEWCNHEARKHLVEATVCIMRCMKTIETGAEVPRPRYSMDDPDERGFIK